MARKLRVQYEGAIYHVMNRGDRREDIFHDDDDRRLFLKTLGETCEKTAWQIHAYCLMRNHFHLVIETPRANLVAGMKWFLGTYTARFNRRHKYFGHLFSGRYKSLIVDGSGNGYLRTVCDYVHLNPARANLLKKTAPWRIFAGAVTRPTCWSPRNGPSGCASIVSWAKRAFPGTVLRAGGNSASAPNGAAGNRTRRCGKKSSAAGCWAAKNFALNSWRR